MQKGLEEADSTQEVPRPGIEPTSISAMWQDFKNKDNFHSYGPERQENVVKQ